MNSLNVSKVISVICEACFDYFFFNYDLNDSLLVKAAEANAEAQYLSGVGVAKQRKAIVDGLKTSIVVRAVMWGVSVFLLKGIPTNITLTQTELR